MNEKKEKDFQDKIKKLTVSNLPLSAHTIMGWYGNFQRVKRFYIRYLQETESEKKLDYALSFFIFSYHLRDWILRYESIDKEYFDKQWEKFLQDFPEIKISRDISNVSKHLKISQESTDKNFALFWEYDPFVTKENDWTIVYGEKKERLLDLMRRTLDAWGDFIIDYLQLVKE